MTKMYTGMCENVCMRKSMYAGGGGVTIVSPLFGGGGGLKGLWVLKVDLTAPPIVHSGELWTANYESPIN